MKFMLEMEYTLENVKNNNRKTLLACDALQSELANMMGEVIAP